MTTAAPRRPNARGQGDLLRDEIVDCAVRLLGELADDAALSLRAVARELSISPTSVYLYFPDRDALVLAAMRRCHEDITRAAAGATGLRDRILAHAAWAQAHPGLFKVMHESRTSDRMPFKRESLDQVAAGVQEHMDAGTIPPGDALSIALDLRAAVVGAVSLRINEPGLPWPPLAEQIDRYLSKLAGL